MLVIAGKDREKKGKIIQTFPREAKVVVDGVNKVTKHMKPQRRDQKGQKIEFFGPVAVSNLMLICPRCEKPTRIGYKLVDNKKQRICKRCKEDVK